MRYLKALLKIHISKGPGHGQLAHHAVVDHEATGVSNALGFVLSSGLVVFRHTNRREISTHRKGKGGKCEDEMTSELHERLCTVEYSLLYIYFLDWI